MLLNPPLIFLAVVIGLFGQDNLSSTQLEKCGKSFCPGQSGQKRAQEIFDSVFTASNFGAEDTGVAHQNQRTPWFLSSKVARLTNGLPQVLSRSLHLVASHCKMLHLISGQKRDKLLAAVCWLMLLSATLAILTTVFQPSPQRTREEMERDAITKIEELFSEFGDRISATGSRIGAAVYVRFSTDRQNSFESQLRAMFAYAAEHGFSISRENIFYDLGYSGARTNRAGLTAVREARIQGRFQVFMAFCSSRLARNLATLLQVLDEEFVANGIRCVLIDQRLDSNERDRWATLLPILGWLDQMQRTAQSGNIRAEHLTLLSRRLHYTTARYGIGGETIPGFFTKRGRPVQLMVIDDAMAKVVRYIFVKFINHVPIGWIAKRLNTHRNWPRPPKSKVNRFSRDFVKRALENPVYIGIFVYNDNVDVSSMSPGEMRELAVTDPNVFYFPELQIITDEQFLKARGILRSNQNRHQSAVRMPRSRDGDAASRPMLLNGFLFCPVCDNQLVVTGAKGNAYGCKSCKNLPVNQQNLYSQMPRKLATDLIAKAICDTVLRAPDVVDACVEECLAEFERMAQPDATRLESLRAERNRKRSQLDLVISNFTGGDEHLVQDQLQQLRSELNRLDTEITVEQRLVEQVVELPTANQIRESLSQFSTILVQATECPSDEQLDEARELIRIVTGGRIDVYQKGEKKAKLGWLQVRFKVNLAAVALHGNIFNPSSSANDEIELVVDIQQPSEANPMIAKARELYDADKFETEIAEELDVSRGCIFKWLAQSFEADGIEKADGYKRRKRIETARGLHHYQLISDQVFELADSGVLLCEIAERLKTNRDVITESLRYAYQKRNLPWLDGRARRKSLDRKSR